MEKNNNIAFFGEYILMFLSWSFSNLRQGCVLNRKKEKVNFYAKEVWWPSRLYAFSTSHTISFMSKLFKRKKNFHHFCNILKSRSGIQGSTKRISLPSGDSQYLLNSWKVYNNTLSKVIHICMDQPGHNIAKHIQWPSL